MIPYISYFKLIIEYLFGCD